MVDMKEKAEIRHRMLVQFADDLKSDDIPAMIRKPEKEGEVEVVSVLFEELGEDREEAYGEFLFRPITSEEDQVQYFIAMITIRDDLNPEHLPALYRAVSYLNSVIPCGNFAVDMTDTFLSYRLCVPLDMDLSSEELYNEMNIMALNAIALTDTYMGVLLGIDSGRDTVDDLKELFGA